MAAERSLSKRKRRMAISDDYLVTFPPKKKPKETDITGPQSIEQTSRENDEKEIAALAIIELFQKQKNEPSTSKLNSKCKEETKSYKRIEQRKEIRKNWQLKLTTKCGNDIHESIVLETNDLLRRVEICRGNDCGCGLYHCPLCEVDFFKPVKFKSTLRKHVMTHVKYVVKYGELSCCLCRLLCGACLQSHYHCPVCYERHSKRAAFVKHLQRHETESGRENLDRIQTRDSDNQRRAIDVHTPLSITEQAPPETIVATSQDEDKHSETGRISGTVDADDSHIPQEENTVFYVIGQSDNPEYSEGFHLTESRTEGKTQEFHISDVVEDDQFCILPSQQQVVYYVMNDLGELERTQVETDATCIQSLGNVIHVQEPNVLQTGETLETDESAQVEALETLVLESPIVADVGEERVGVEYVYEVEGDSLVLKSGDHEKVDYVLEVEEAKDSGDIIVMKDNGNDEVGEVQKEGEHENIFKDFFEEEDEVGEVGAADVREKDDLSKSTPIINDTETNADAEIDRLERVASVADSMSLPDKILEDESDDESNDGSTKDLLEIQVDIGGYIDGQKFKDLGELERMALQNYICEDTSEPFKFVQVRNDKGVIEYPCAQCHVVKKSKDAIYRHYRRDHCDKRFTCTKCPRRYAQFTDLKQHLPRCKGETKVLFRSNQCPICVKVFATKKSLRRHYQVFHNPKNVQESFTCTACDKSFSQQRYLRAHLLRFHESIDRFFCPVCKKGFKLKFHLKEHSKVHDRNRPDARWKCRTCGKSFERVQGWEDHMNIHEQKKPHACEDCDVSYASRSALAKHRAMKHGSQTRFTCSICSDGFAYKHLLRKHTMLFHEQNEKEANSNEQETGTMDNPHLRIELGVISCVYCGLLVSSEEERKVHWSQGEGEIPKCLNFVQIDNNKVQASPKQRIQEVFQCSVCEAMFDDWQMIVSHMASEHNTNVAEEDEIEVTGTEAIENENLDRAGLVLDCDAEDTVGVDVDACDGGEIAAFVEAASTDPDAVDVIDVSQYLKQISPKKRVELGQGDAGYYTDRGQMSIGMTSILKNFKPL